MIISSFLTIQTLKLEDSNHWQTYGTKDGITIKIDYEQNVSEDAIYDALTYVGKHYDVSLFKSSDNYIDNQVHINKAVYLNHDLQDIHISEGRLLQPLDNETSVYISSDDPVDEQCVGKIEDEFGDDHINIMTLNYYYEQGNSMYGNYTIHSPDLTVIDQSIEELSMYLNIPRENLVANNEDYLSDSNTIISILSTLNMLLLFTFVAGLFYYAENNIKKIGIYKLNGISIGQIYFILMKSVLITEIMTLVILFVLEILFLDQLHFSTIVTLGFNHLKYFLITGLLSSVLYWLISKMTLSRLLKNESWNHYLIVLNYLIKIISMGIVFYCFASVMVTLNNSMLLKEKATQWESYQDYAVIQHYISNPKDEEFFSHLYEEETLNQLLSFYQGVSDMGAYYADTIDFNASLNYDGKPISAYETIGTIPITPELLELDMMSYTLNTNLLHTFDVVDMEGNKIYIDPNETDKILLIPYSLSDSAESIVHLYQLKWLQEADLDTLQENTSYIVYDDQKQNSFFSFNTEYFEVVSPVFEVYTNQNVYPGEMHTILNSGISSPLKYPMQGMDLETFSKKMQTVFDTYFNGQLTGMQFQSLGGLFGEELDFTHVQFTRSLYMVIVIMILYVGMIIYETHIYMKLNIKKMAVKKLNGLSTLTCFKPYLITTFVLDLLCLILYFVSIHSHFSFIVATNRYHLYLQPFVYIAGVVLICLEMLVFIFYILKIENKSISKYLKGTLYGNN